MSKVKSLANKSLCFFFLIVISPGFAETRADFELNMEDWVGKYPHNKETGERLLNHSRIQESLMKVLSKYEFEDFQTFLKKSLQVRIKSIGSYYSIAYYEIHAADNEYRILIRKSDLELRVCKRIFSRTNERENYSEDSPIATWYGPNGYIRTTGLYCVNDDFEDPIRYFSLLPADLWNN